jgi:hypothetical protein
MIYLYYKLPILSHIIEMISFVLSKHNILHITTNTITPELAKQENNLWIGLWHSTDLLPKNFISLNVEPLNVFNWDKAFLDKFKKSLHILDYSSSHQEFYKLHNIINFSIVPFGYCQLHEYIYKAHVTKKIEENKDIDVLFYGGMCERRHKILFQVIKFCKENKYNFVLRDNNLYDYKEKSIITARTKIVISVGAEEPSKMKTNDLLRLSFLISNKVFILPEELGDNEIENKLKTTIPFYKFTRRIVY